MADQFHGRHFGHVRPDQVAHSGSADHETVCYACGFARAVPCVAERADPPTAETVKDVGSDPSDVRRTRVLALRFEYGHERGGNAPNGSVRPSLFFVVPISSVITSYSGSTCAEVSPSTFFQPPAGEPCEAYNGFNGVGQARDHGLKFGAVRETLAGVVEPQCRDLRSCPVVCHIRRPT